MDISQTLVVAALSAAGGGALVWFFGGFANRAGEDAYEAVRKRWFPRKDVEPEKADRAISINVVAPAAPANSETNPRSHGQDLFSAIKRALEEAPSLQKKAVASRYVGTKVRWETTFFHAHEMDEGRVRVVLLGVDSRMHPTISAVVQLSDYPELSYMREGHVVDILGTLAEVLSYDFRLEDATLQFKSEDFAK